MQTYIIRRLLLVIPTLLIVSMFVFAIARLIPGDVLDLMIAEQEPSQVEVSRADLIKKLGLDVPIHIQYIRWLGNIILHGDLGESLWTSRKVTEEIFQRAPVSAELGILALITSIIGGISLGIYSAIRQDTIGDYIGRSLSILSLSLP